VCGCVCVVCVGVCGTLWDTPGPNGTDLPLPLPVTQPQEPSGSDRRYTIYISTLYLYIALIVSTYFILNNFQL